MARIGRGKYAEAIIDAQRLMELSPDDDASCAQAGAKALLAAQVLARVDAGQESLTRMIDYGEKDLIFVSPVTRAHLAARC